MAIIPGDPVVNVQPSSAGGGGWLAGEAFPAAKLLKPEALLQREGLAAHLLAQFVELPPFLNGDRPLDGLAALWLGSGHRPVKPSRPPDKPHSPLWMSDNSTCRDLRIPQDSPAALGVIELESSILVEAFGQPFLVAAGPPSGLIFRVPLRNPYFIDTSGHTP